MLVDEKPARIQDHTIVILVERYKRLDCFESVVHHLLVVLYQRKHDIAEFRSRLRAEERSRY